MTKNEIKKLEKSLMGLGNDARYWDLRRTYGDHSVEVLRHLRTCAEYQASTAAGKAGVQ